MPLEDDPKAPNPVILPLALNLTLSVASTGTLNFISCRTRHLKNDRIFQRPLQKEYLRHIATGELPPHP